MFAIFQQQTCVLSFLFYQSCFTTVDATIVLINLHAAATATPRVLISIILFFGSNNPKTIGHALLLFLYLCYIRSKKKSGMMFSHLELYTGCKIERTKCN